MSVKESTLEAVLEKPAHDESVPEFDESEWARQMGDSEPLPSSGGDKDPPDLSVALAAPAPLDDLWPGHCYIPPRISHLKTMIAEANSAEAKWENGEYIEAAEQAAAMIQPIVRRVKGKELVEIEAKEIEDEFEVIELIRIVHFILRDQGLEVEGVSGNAPSGRSIGVKNFLSSAAITEPMTSSNAENSPSPS